MCFLRNVKLLKKSIIRLVFFVFNDTLLVFYILTLCWKNSRTEQNHILCYITLPDQKKKKKKKKSLKLVLFDPPVSFNFGRYLQHKIRQLQKDWRYWHFFIFKMVDTVISNFWNWTFCVKNTIIFKEFSAKLEPRFTTPYDKCYLLKLMEPRTSPLEPS